jgi:hypothetical protein
MPTKNLDFVRGRTEMTLVSIEKPENPKRQLKYLKFIHGPQWGKMGGQAAMNILSILILFLKKIIKLTHIQQFGIRKVDNH